MAKPSRALQLNDIENGQLHVVWSRSGKHLIVTVSGQNERGLAQMELRPDQVNELIAFLVETVDHSPTDR